MKVEEIRIVKDRPRKHVKVTEVQPVDVGEMTGEVLPAKMLKVNVGGDRRGVVFTISKTARAAMDDMKLAQIARTLGDLVHPSPATLIVLPDGEQLHAYELEAE